MAIMKVTDPLAYRSSILWLNGIALTLAFAFAVGEASWRMFGPNSYGPIVLSILALSSALIALTVGRRSKPALFAAIATSGVMLAGVIALASMLFRSMMAVGLPISGSEWVALTLAILLLIALLGNVFISLSLLSRLRRAI
jgi:hypothetical protein